MNGDWRDAVLPGAMGGLMAGMQLTLPATLMLMLAQQLTLASMQQGHPDWFTRPQDTSNAGLVKAIVAAGLGWFAAAAVINDPPHLYDGVPTPLRIR